MDFVADARISKTGDFTNEFSLFPTSFEFEDRGEQTPSRLTREQMDAFLAASDNARGPPLTQCGPNGECLRCLVSFGFLADGEQAEKPAARGRLTPGPLRYAHFEVEVGPDGFPVELGAGAMAITYRARDTVLTSTVALKVIDRKAAQNPDARSRFLREARATANTHHPNVAQVTYYGEQDGECFRFADRVSRIRFQARIAPFAEIENRKLQTHR